ncbi:MAG: Omp28-related outer membrane protein, partial [Brumimicrobium sp.]
SADAASFHDLHEYRSSTPVFYANTVNEVAYSQAGGIYTAATKTNIINAVDSTRAQSPIVNSGFTQSISGNTLTVDTKVKYFQNTSGEYYLGVYLTEDNVEANQNGITGTATHKRIMRASIHPNIEGTLISNGSVSAGAEFSDSHTFTIDQSWNPDYLKVFTVIWKKVGSEFVYENAYQKQGYASVHNIDATTMDATIFPNVAAGDQDITLEINNASKQNVSIEVYDQVGKKVSTIYNGDLTENHYEFNVNPTRSLNKGLYYVNIISDQKSKKTIKLVVGK